MNASEALSAARAFGLTVTSDDKSLFLEAEFEPPQTVLDALARHNAAILDLLRAEQFKPSGEHWSEYFRKRCQIAVSNRGLSRAEAERLALECCVTEWLNQHAIPSPPGLCASCGKVNSPRGEVLPFGIEPGKHVWLHAECWPAWHSGRRAEALDYFASLGIFLG
jgi:hypothetical protein